MLQKIAASILVFSLLVGGASPNERVNAVSEIVTIKTNILNVRTGPGLSYPVIEQVKTGESFNLTNKKGDWYEISLSSGKKGWVANWLVNTEAEQTTSETLSKEATILVNGLRIRKGPGTNFQITGYLNKGSKVTVTKQNENWVEITSSSGDGWISNEFIQYQSNSQEEKKKESNQSKPSQTGTILVDRLNIRLQSNLTSNVIGQLSKDDKVSVLSIKGDWVKILYKNNPAWISKQFVKITKNDEGTTPTEEDKNDPSKDNQEADTPKSSIKVSITASSLNVRSEASLNGTVIGSVTFGQEFTILEEKNNWCKIELNSGKQGWVANWFVSKIEASVPSEEQTINDSFVTILHNGTNIRQEATVQSNVVLRANEGDQFPIVAFKNDWYEILLPNQTTAFIAGWIVTVVGDAPKVNKPGAEQHLANKTIVLDPGHGGRDNGTTGSRGTIEKELTIRTAKLLYDKLRAAGANVVLTRSNDSYLSLRTRVSTAHYHKADAFLSIHYDSILDSSVRGMTSYYYHQYQQPLAMAIHGPLLKQAMLKDRGVRFGDYHVLRENKQAAVLLELGYLSNPTEEMTVATGSFQENITSAIYNGLAQYFKK